MYKRVVWSNREESLFIKLLRERNLKISLPNHISADDVKPKLRGS